MSLYNITAKQPSQDNKVSNLQYNNLTNNNFNQTNKNKHFYKSDQLCKFFISGSCNKGSSCHFSHDLKKFPCKFYHALGYCDKANFCPFSHLRLLTEKDIFNFIETNLDFLNELNTKIGWNNMDEFYKKHLQQNKPNISTSIPEDFYKSQSQVLYQKNTISNIAIPNVVNNYPQQSFYKSEVIQTNSNIAKETNLHCDESNIKQLVPNFIDPFMAFK